MATATYTSLHAGEVGVGRAIDLRSMKGTHTMFVRVLGQPAFYEVWLSVSHDGEHWYDAGSVGGSFPDDHATFMVGFSGAARFVRAHLTRLTISPEHEATVIATIGSA
jgi:hypothetical protein